MRRAAAQALSAVSPATLVDLLPASYSAGVAFEHRSDDDRLTAAECAIQRNDWVLTRELYALLSDNSSQTELSRRIEKHAESERQLIMDAPGLVVVVLSTRYSLPLERANGERLSYSGLTPLAVSDLVKAHVEALCEMKVKCFNPNRDNAAIQGGDEAKANGIWLKTWRQALVRAKQTGGCMIRLDVEEVGLSAMQEAETDMAMDKGVPVVTVRFNMKTKDADITVPTSRDPPPAVLL